MNQLPEMQSWRPEIDPGYAEMRVRSLREQILAADIAIEAEQLAIAREGPQESHLQAINNLRASQEGLERDLADLMVKRELEVVDFALTGPKYDQHRASAKTLAVFFDTIQRLFERVGQAMHSTRITPTIPDSLRRQCQLEIAGFFPSSFGIRFTTKTSADLTGSSITGSALAATFDLVNSANPVEQAANLGQRTLIQYRHLITTLIKAEATPKAHWRQPDGVDRHWITDDHDLQVLANRLAKIHDMPPQTMKATGLLTGASLRRHKFEFESDSGRVAGKAPSELAHKVTRYFGKPCQITFIETRFIDEATHQEKRSRVLVDLEDA